MSSDRVDQRELAAIEASGRFDADFYLRTYRDSIPTSMMPLEHYLAEGEEKGLLASRDFDPIVYKLWHPTRRHHSPLVDLSCNRDQQDYRDIGALFRNIAIESRTPIRYPRHYREEWAKYAQIVVENVDRSVRLQGCGLRYELRNPHPEVVLARLAEDRPFAIARLPDGFWEQLLAIEEIRRRLCDDPRFQPLNKYEQFNVAQRLRGRGHLLITGTNAVENFYQEILPTLPGNRNKENYWLGISVFSLPTFDDCFYALDKEDLAQRIRLISRFFKSSDALYDASTWKRWALSGHLALLAEEARRHPVVMVGPGKFHTLGEKWRLSRFHHVAIPRRRSQLIRHSILQQTIAALNAVGELPHAKPIVLFQCGASIGYWLIDRLRKSHPDVFFLDLGQALDVWYWTGLPWMHLYREALCRANPFAQPAEEQARPEPDAAGSLAAQAATDVADILWHDYLSTGLCAPPPWRLVCVLDGRFRPIGAHGWWIRLPADLASLTDGPMSRSSSPLLLLEDGKPSGIGHESRGDIKERGGGRYSFWGDSIYFSTRDGSNPNHNGRTYSIGRTDITDG